MKTTENSQLVTASEEIAEMGTQKIISICDHVNWLNYSHDNSDSFVIDMNNFTGKEVPANPRIARNLSRKGAHGGGKEKSVPYLSVSHRQGKEHDSALHSLSPSGKLSCHCRSRIPLANLWE
ncbi:hypothetical protein SAY87_022323 [Trapa incisa]|uniref:Uncharacterized protein n=1 Tax=Trapa incisa TaxID=236973 RepID=A0AAN7K416_9MYRT|nr:hypothetical protein SAY87_022323 [Trapa incisa]